MKMPNWCDNNVFLQHEDESMIERAEQAFNRGEFMNEFYPCPKELHDTVAGFLGKGTYEQELLELKEELNNKWFGAKNWYDWQVSHWGTKWDVGTSDGCGDGCISRSPSDLIVSFASAWNPPLGFYEKLEDLGFKVKAYYYESGCAFCGVYENGQDDCYSIEGNSSWVIDNIPADIDNEMGISEGMANWEEKEENA
jgi:hypothetical protein